MPYWDRIDVVRPKRLLAIDGGGIRGALSLEILASIEDLLRADLNAGDRFVLGDYFDYIGGSSSGAIIAAGLAVGMRVDELRELYATRGAEMFDKAFITRRLHYHYRSDLLERMLKSVIGEETVFGDPMRLRTLLMVIMRNATTDSAWPLSNNPRARYNDPRRSDCNLRLPLWQLVRASTAAPTYFPPETINLGSKRSVFVDAGVTVSNNPAFQLFLMATLEEYRLGWRTGTKELLLISVGSGTNPRLDESLRPSRMTQLYSAQTVPVALMLAASMQQDTLCRLLGTCRHVPFEIDREIGDLMNSRGLFDRRLFSYARYNVELNAKGLAALGLFDIVPENVQLMDSIEHIGDLQRIGVRVGHQVRPEHFAGFLG